MRQRYGSPCGTWVARSVIDLPAAGIFVAVLGRGPSPPNPGRLAWRSPPIQLQVTGTQVGDFLDAGARVGHRQQRGMIALAGVLEGDRQDGLAHPAVVGEQGCRVAYEGVQCSQADVARRRGAAAVALWRCWRKESGCSREIRAVQGCGRSLQTALEEDKRELERIAAGAHAMSAETADAVEVVREEAAQGLAQRVGTGFSRANLPGCHPIRGRWGGRRVGRPLGGPDRSRTGDTQWRRWRRALWPGREPAARPAGGRGPDSGAGAHGLHRCASYSEIGIGGIIPSPG